MSATFYATTALLSQPSRLIFRMKAYGLDRVPATGGFVIASNHISNFDPWPLGLLLWPRRRLHFMAKSELYENAVLRWFLNGVDAFPVARETRDRKAIDTAIQLARDGEAVAIFPEGTRRPKSEARTYVGRALTGTARIALSAKVPIVPAALTGTDRLSRLGPLRVSYGDPIPAEGRPRELTARMMGDIERLLEKM